MVRFEKEEDVASAISLLSRAVKAIVANPSVRDYDGDYRKKPLTIAINSIQLADGYIRTRVEDRNFLNISILNTKGETIETIHLSGGLISGAKNAFAYSAFQYWLTWEVNRKLKIWQHYAKAKYGADIALEELE